MVGDKCYIFESAPKTHADAVSHCMTVGAKLVEIMTDQENTNLYDLFGPNFWIGVHDVNFNGQMVYDSTGVPITYDNWYEGEPNDFGSEDDCAVTSVGGEWNDLPCSETKSFVCETTL